MGAGCVDLEPGNGETLYGEIASNFTVNSTFYYPVSGSQNPFGLEGEVEAYGPMVAAADFNKDGNPDLAIENNYTAVMVRLGNGSGGFGAETRYSLGGTVRPNAVIARDLNADGDVDLVTANSMSLSVLINRGNGTFGNASSYAISGCSWQPCHGSVTAADFNGDGKIDLAAGMDGGIGVFLGNGNGTFGSRITQPCSGTHHNSVTAADFNGDGKVDLATAASWGSSVYIFAGKGNGTFAACTASTVGSRPQSMTMGDFNMDGRPDLATANSWGISISVLLNQGNGTFVTQSYPFAGSAYQMLFVGAAHVNGDGLLDLLVGHQTSLFIMSGKSGGTFATPETIALSEPPRFVMAGRCPTDPPGSLDFLVSSDAGRIVVLKGTP